MDPRQLQRVLHLGEAPRGDMRPATLEGYRIRMWGPYPVLLEALHGEVRGLAYEVAGGAEAKDWLAAYGTGNYRERRCMIRFGGGGEGGGDYVCVGWECGGVEGWEL